MHPQPRVGLGVLIFNTEGCILLGKRLSAHGTCTFGPPGGHLEYGESFEACALREVFEETGLRITDPQFLALTNDVFEPDQKHYVSIFMRASFPEGQGLQVREPLKTEKWDWFSLQHLPANLFLPLKHFLEGKAYSLENQANAHANSL